MSNTFLKKGINMDVIFRIIFPFSCASIYTAIIRLNIFTKIGKSMTPWLGVLVSGRGYIGHKNKMHQLLSLSFYWHFADKLCNNLSLIRMNNQRFIYWRGALCWRYDEHSFILYKKFILFTIELNVLLGWTGMPLGGRG